MASIKVKFQPSAEADHEGTIFYQVLHERKRRLLFPDYHVFPYEWDENRSLVTTNQKSKRTPTLLSIRERIHKDVELLNKIIRKLENDGTTYTTDDIIDEFNRLSDKYSLFKFMDSLIVKLKRNGKIRTAETYISTLNSFRKFRNGEDIMLFQINSDI